MNRNNTSNTTIGFSIAPTGEKGRRVSAFTLIELLVVIAIIGVLAALVLPISGIASAKMRISRLRAELNRYVNAIETYKLETGEYPPDHGQLAQISSNDWTNYRRYASLNPLYYELTGVVFTNGQFVTVDGNEIITPAAMDTAFKRTGIRNSARHKNEIDYKGFSLKESNFAELDPATFGLGAADDIEILKVPVKGPFQVKGRTEKEFNPWFYDASSTNRHNKGSFDLWAEILIQGKTNIIGNWK